jgi:hypothetical protein
VDEIHGFESIANYIELTRRVDGAVADRALAPIPVRRPYANVGLNEQWYEEPSEERWRLFND